MIWNSFAFISLVCSLLSTASAVLSFSAKRKGISLLSGLMYSVLAVWSFGLFLCLSSATSSDALLWSRTANYVVLFLPAIVFHFVAVFVGQRSALARIIFLYYILSLTYFSIILLAPDSFLHSPSVRFGEFWFPVGGSLFYFFPVLFVAVIGHALNVLFSERVSRDHAEKLKIDYLIMTIIFGLLGGGLSLSLEFNINIPPYGIMNVALMVIVSTYAVLKHDLLELPETLSIVITRLMIYVCIFAFVVLVLKGGVFLETANLSLNQVLFIAAMTILVSEFYAAIKTRLQRFADHMLVRQKIDSEKQFRELMYQLDGANDFEAMLPLLRSFFETQSYVHHYAWYLDRVLLEYVMKKRNLEDFEHSAVSQDKNYQRILFSANEGRRHDRLPVSLRQAAELCLSDESANKQMNKLMTSEQLDAVYTWVGNVPGREMIGLPIIAEKEFRGVLLLVVSRSEMRFVDQSRLQALALKLAMPIERMEFYRVQAAQEQKLLFQKMASLQALAGSIADEMRSPLKQLNHFVDEVEQGNARASLTSSLELSARQARTAIERSLQVIDVTLGLVKNAPIDAGMFNEISIQAVVTKALAEYVFLPGERARVHCDLRQEFIFKGDESLLVYMIFNLLKNSLGSRVSTRNFEISIDSRIEADSNVLIFHDSGLGISKDELPYIFEDFYSNDASQGVGLGLAYCARVMTAFGGDIACCSELGEYTEFRMSFPFVTRCAQQDEPTPKHLSPVQQV